MGSGRIIECNNCGHEIRLFTGVGMKMAPYKYELPPSHEASGWNIVSQKTILKKVEDLMQNKKGKFIAETKDLPVYIRNRFNGITDDEFEDVEEEKFHIYNSSFAYGYKIYYSYNTKQVYSLFQFYIQYEENNEIKYYEPTYYDKFRKPLTILKSAYDIPNDDVICPKCKKKITIDPFVISFCNWD